MKVLIIGSGGREHALAWQCAQFDEVVQVFVAPGNAGSALENKISNIQVDSEDIPGLIKFVQSESIDITIVGPEAPLVIGIVDEFQDISSGRNNLINSLITQNPSLKILVVGDDWQSIYRFAGSDISLVRKFEHFFGNTIEMFLSKSFRFNSQINEFSKTFIMDKLYNRGSNVQISKDIHVETTVTDKKIFLHWKNKSNQQKLELSLSDIAARIKKYSENDKLLILARYNHNLPKEDNFAE